MLIREDAEYTTIFLNNSKYHKVYSQEKTGLHCEVKCDNPECGKTFYRKKSYVNHKKHYCSVKCRITNYGICKVDGCEEKFLNRSNNKSSMCRKHRNRYINVKLRSELLELMGGACVCCGERDPMFLQVDHVFNDGHKDRKKYKGGSISNASLLKIWNETPERLQLLCANCNHAKVKNGGVLYHPEKFTRRKLRS